MAKTVVGLYRDFQTAERVVRELTDAGIPREDISLVAQDHSRTGTVDTTTHDEGVGDGIATGAGTGAVLGGLGGLLVGLGALAIPGVGPIIAAGPIASALAGAGIGAVAGGLVGALVDAGVPEEDATAYSTGVQRGGTLITVMAPDNMAQRTVDIMNRYNPVNIRQPGWESGFTSRQERSFTNTTMDTTRTGGMHTGHTTGEHHTEHLDEGEARIPIVEEEVRVGKREVEKGGVRIEKEVIEQPFEETHTVRSERVDVERRNVDRPLTGVDAENAFRDETIEVTETSEELIVDKQARITGEVVVRKDVEEHEETVRGTTRRTDVDVEHLDTGTTRSTGTTGTTGAGFSSGDWDTYATDFRTHYNTSFSHGGRDYTYYEPAYRYGYTLAGNERYQGRNWNDIEMEARRSWELEHRDSAWDDVKDAIRHGWERVSGQRR